MKCSNLSGGATTLRILCLGFEQPAFEFSDECVYASLAASFIPTIFDYDIVIMNLSKLYRPQYTALAERREEFEKFFQSKGTCYVLADEYDECDGISNYAWCPFDGYMAIENKSGTTLICQEKNARFVFDELEFRWKCYFSRYPDKTTVLATNRANDPISLLVPCESGYCIFLPSTDEPLKPLILLIREGRNIIPPEKEEEIVTEEPPSWATEYMTEKELNLLRQRNKIIEKLGKYNKFKGLLWETGDALEVLVIDAFKEIGITVLRLPKESHGDFEFPIKEDLTGVCEVKGLLGNGDRRNLRQLLDYFIEQRDIERRNVKGVFIVNHFRNEKPSERGEPATQDAVDLIQTYDFAILTTTQLYDSLVEFWENRLSKEDFLKRFH